VDGTRFPGGVRLELVELATMLVRETKTRGYVFGTAGDPSYGCWGYSCRAISGSNSPSNHSWGLALDINAPSNPYTSPLVTDMPDWMPELWNAYGWRWGGDYSGSQDAMHYEYMGSVTECAQDTDRAHRDGIGGGTPPTTGDWFDMATPQEITDAMATALAGNEDLHEIRRMVGVAIGGIGGGGTERALAADRGGDVQVVGENVEELRRLLGVAIGYPPGSDTEHNLAQQ
jgi:hypothetical protein